MKFRFIALLCALAFFAGLGVVVGQRLAAEALAVMVGVMAGAATSIPTSLIVVWYATRNLTVTPPPEPEAESPAEYPAPRVVWTPPSGSATAPIVWHPQGAYQNFAGYPPAAYPTYPYPVEQMPASARAPAPSSRRFTVIGGADSLDEPETFPEVTWLPR